MYAGYGCVFAWLYVTAGDNGTIHHVNKLIRTDYMGHQPNNIATRTVCIGQQLKRREIECMHAREDNNHDLTHMHANLKLKKKAITTKPSIQIKFGMHYYLSYDKIFKTRPHLPMFALYIFKVFFDTK